MKGDEGLQGETREKGFVYTSVWQAVHGVGTVANTSNEISFVDGGEHTGSGRGRVRPRAVVVVVVVVERD